MQKQKTKDKKIIIYNKWDLIAGIIILFCASFALSILPLSTSIMYLWFPLILSTALGMSFIMVFAETGWYMNIIIATIIAISNPLSAMSPNKMGVIMLIIGIAVFGNLFGFGITMLLKSLKEKGAIK